MNSATLFVYEIGRAITLYVCVRNRTDNLHEHSQNSTELAEILYTTNSEILLVRNIPEINPKHIYISHHLVIFLTILSACQMY